MRRPRLPKLVPMLPMLALWAGAASASTYGFLDQGAMRYFSAEDTRLMSGTLNAVLTDPADRQPHEWRNDETGSRGSVIATATFTTDGLTCRRITIQNHARGIDGRSIADMCDVGGVWKVLRMPN